MNVSQKTIDAVQEMVDSSFQVTATIDRMQSVLNVKFACNNVAELIHKGMAHAYSGIFGDKIAETIEKYNISIWYGNVQRDKMEYDSVKQLLLDLQEIIIEYQNKLNMCTKIAFDEMDIHVYSDLLEIVKEHNAYVEQAILLVDKIELYGSNVASFDAHIKEHFWIL